jgi:putative ABC transport system ATP-binding protein
MEIKAINISKSFGERRILDGISIDINEGDFLAFVGESGAGKTTLISILNSLIRPTSGNVYYDGKLFTRLSPCEKATLRSRRISMILQQPAFFRNLSVRDNVFVPYYLTGSSPKEVKELYEEYSTTFGLKEKEKLLPGQLSGGEVRKMILLRAVLKPHSILFADEPTADLDRKSLTQVMTLFARLNKMGKTIVLSTHDPNLSRIAKDVYEIRETRCYCKKK